MRTCYLHIGAPKAGSTTIQGFLGDFRKELAKTGLDVPDFGHGEIISGPLALSGALKRERNPDAPESETWRWLDRHLAKTSGDLCISREGLCNHLAELPELSFTQSFFRRRGVRLKMIAYVRDHVGYLNAAYAQQAKKLRLTESFEDWLETAIASGRYVYWRRFRLLFDAADVEFSVTPLQQVAEGGLIADFCAQIDRPGFDASGFDSSPYRNSTPGPKALAAALIVGRGLKERGIDPDFDQSLHRRFKLAVEARGWNEKPFFGPDQVTADAIEQAFAKGDARLAARAWNVDWRDVAPPTIRPRNVFDPACASEAERAEIEDLAAEVLAHAPSTERPLWKRLLPQKA